MKMVFINNALLNWRFSYHQQHSNAHSQLTAIHGHIDSVGFGWRRLFIHIHIQYEWYLWFGSFTENTKDLSNSNKPSCSYCQRNHCHCRHSLFFSRSLSLTLFYAIPHMMRTMTTSTAMAMAASNGCHSASHVQSKLQAAFFPLTNPTHFLMNVFRTFVLCIYPVAVLRFHRRILYYSHVETWVEKDRKSVCAHPESNVYKSKHHIALMHRIFIWIFIILDVWRIYYCTNTLFVDVNLHRIMCILQCQRH